MLFLLIPVLGFPFFSLSCQQLWDYRRNREIVAGLRRLSEMGPEVDSPQFIFYSVITLAFLKLPVSFCKNNSYLSVV